MYLHDIYVENSGPINKLTINCPMGAGDSPKPVVLVGGNGSGKTSLLSTIGDALFEAAAAHYSNVVPDQSVGHRSWFRVVGRSTISSGAAGGCSLLRFRHDGKDFFYAEKGGELDPAELKARAPAVFESAIQWGKEIYKHHSIRDEDARDVFEQGAYAYFPSSRFEVPHWLNRASIQADDIDLGTSFIKQLRKPIYVERGLDKLKQWLMAVLLESRMDVNLQVVNQQVLPIGVGDFGRAIPSKVLWDSINRILRAILDSETARLVWGGRNAPFRLGVELRKGGPSLPLEALSAGQSTLLSLFGTLARYGDNGQGGLQSLAEMRGICVIDEIDAHMHIDLQYRALPALMATFKKVQFVVSSHSPLFILGLEKQHKDGAVIVELPEGRTIAAESYSEFGRALEVLRDTQAFSNAVMVAAAASESTVLVLVEGETDPKYIRAAAERLGRTELLQRAELSWVGAKDPRSGQGFHTGKSALDTTSVVLRAKPDLVKRSVLLLYDNDAGVKDADAGKLHVRQMPTNPKNGLVSKGIENLLPESVFTDEMYDIKVLDKRNGQTVTTRTLDKMRLCAQVCESDAGQPQFFEAFGPLLDLIEGVVSVS